jgi:putative hydrolase of the HAD superfamily
MTVKYKAIGFDFGGVIRGRPGTFFVYEMSRLLNVSEEDYKKVYWSHNQKINRSEITWEELWRLVVNDLGQPDKLADVLALNNSGLDLVIHKNMLSLVDNIKSKGFTVGLLSNNTLEGGRDMRRRGIDKHFDAFDISAETGFVKPQVEAFEHFAKELGVKPEQLIFIDDTEHSLISAEQVGYTPILYKNYQQLTEDLSALLNISL